MPSRMNKLGTLSSQLDLDSLVYHSPSPYVILSPTYDILGANAAYLHLMGRFLEEIVGHNFFEVFPPDPNAPNTHSFDVLQASLARAVTTRQPDSIALVQYNISYPTPHGMIFEERYWSAIHTPVLDERGEVAFLFQNPTDITELVKLQHETSAKQVDVDNTGDQIAGTVFGHAKALATTAKLLESERARLLNLFKQAPGFVAIVLGSQHVIDMVNEAFYQLVGHRDIIGKPALEALPELQEQGYEFLLDQVFIGGDPFVGRQMKLMLQQQPGAPLKERYVDLVYQPFTDADDKIAGIFIQGQDVTEHKLAQDALALSNERWKLAVEGTGDGVWDWDMTTGEVMYSRRFREMFGYSEQEFPSRIEAWSSRIHPEDVQGAFAMIDSAACSREPASDEYRFLCQDGSWKWVRVRGVIVAYSDQGMPTRMTGTITDISEKREADERVWYQANFDTLTGLPNRRLFRDRLGQEIKKAHRSAHSLALMFLDLDRFKEVNDLHGHDAGDLLLVEAAKRLIQCVRATDTVARLGGDEFTVILTELADLSHVEDVAEKILNNLAKPFFLNQQTVCISGSVGITLFEADASTVEQLISNADQAMYAAKHAGRNQFRFFTSSMQEKAQHRLKMANDLRTALATSQMHVLYQPVVHLASGDIVKAEALLRWNHPIWGRVDPAQFIPIAEESGLINEIGDWVFKQAVQCSKHWQSDLGKQVQISINASPVQFQSTEQGFNWLKHLQMLDLLGSNVVVEITEGLLLNASSMVADKLFAYRDAGIQVAIDDFGTGYSSMQYLKKFHIDYLKIDQSFVQEMVHDASDQAIVKSIIAMAHELGLEVIAEGIETAEQREWLLEAGCDYGQGYLFSKPVTADVFEDLISKPMAH